MSTKSATSVFTDASDIFSEVPASVPFEEQVEANIEAQAERDEQHPAPDPFAVTLDNAASASASQAKATKST